MGQLHNLAGQTFGYLTVTSRAPAPEHVKGRLSYWNVVCRCGRTAVLRSDALRDASKRLCGECKIEYQLSAIFNVVRRGEQDKRSTG